MQDYPKAQIYHYVLKDNYMQMYIKEEQKKWYIIVRSDDLWKRYYKKIGKYAVSKNSTQDRRFIDEIAELFIKMLEKSN
jgi:hypothetical protein